jgi:UDP-glucose 4-epimerase
MARAVVGGQPVRIYVPLDTMRDYLFADDAASMLMAGLQRLRQTPDTMQVTKIYAAERDTSIASLLSMFRQVAKRRLLVISGLHATTTQQPRRLSFRSSVWPEDRSRARTDLLAGIAVVFQRQLRAHTMAGAAT